MATFRAQEIFPIVFPMGSSDAKSIFLDSTFRDFSHDEKSYIRVFLPESLEAAGSLKWPMRSINLIG